MEILSHSLAETRQLGAHLGKLAKPGDVFLLFGELGAGKTCLTQGIALGLGIDSVVTSPSFVLVSEHIGRFPLYHIDLYRLEKLDEILELGLDDYFYGNGLSVVEWADRALEALPFEYLKIDLWHVAATTRRLVLKPIGQCYEGMLNILKGQVSTFVGKA